MSEQPVNITTNKVILSLKEITGEQVDESIPAASNYDRASVTQHIKLVNGQMGAIKSGIWNN